MNYNFNKHGGKDNFLHKYTIESINETGSNSLFCKVKEKITGDIVGIKILKDSMLSAERRDKFFRYAKETAISSLIPAHPNLNHFFYSHVFENEIINIVEFIPGISLREYWSNLADEIKPLQILRYAIQIMQGLIFADFHFKTYEKTFFNQNFFHGDIHWNNIMITNQDEAVLIDWGQSYRHEKKSTLYASCAPELIINKNSKGLKSDIFSLSVLIWHCLYNCLPFGNGSYWAEDIEKRIVKIKDIKKRIFNIDQSNIKNDLKKDIYLLLSGNDDKDDGCPLDYSPKQRPSASKFLQKLKKIYKKHQNKDYHKLSFCLESEIKSSNLENLYMTFIRLMKACRKRKKISRLILSMIKEFILINWNHLDLSKAEQYLQEISQYAKANGIKLINQNKIEQIIINKNDSLLKEFIKKIESGSLDLFLKKVKSVYTQYPALIVFQLALYSIGYFFAQHLKLNSQRSIGCFTSNQFTYVLLSYLYNSQTEIYYNLIDFMFKEMLQIKKVQKRDYTDEEILLLEGIYNFIYSNLDNSKQKTKETIYLINYGHLLFA